VRRQRRHGVILCPAAEQRAGSTTVGLTTGTALGHRDLDRENLPRRRRQRSLGRFTPIEFETIETAFKPPENYQPRESNEARGSAARVTSLYSAGNQINIGAISYIRRQVWSIRDLPNAFGPRLQPAFQPLWRS
jgi:hypothetical protein